MQFSLSNFKITYFDLIASVSLHYISSKEKLLRASPRLDPWGLLVPINTLRLFNDTLY